MWFEPEGGVELEFELIEIHMERAESWQHVTGATYSFLETQQAQRSSH